MTDIANLMKDAAASIHATPGHDLAGGDLHRARVTASRLRARRAMVRGLGLAGIAATVTVITVAGHTAAPSQSTASGHSAAVGPRSGTSFTTGVQLVAYTGPQAAGFVVDEVPRGWTIQASTPATLILAPSADSTPAAAVPNSRGVSTPDAIDPRAIVVAWDLDATAAIPGAQPVTVGNVTGSYGPLQGTDACSALTYRDAAGHNIRIQLPDQLHWSAAQASAFAQGVHVTAHVTRTRG